MERLAGALYTNRTVTKLLLGGRELQEDAARALGEVLKKTSALRQLTWVPFKRPLIMYAVHTYGLADKKNTLNLGKAEA